MAPTGRGRGFTDRLARPCRYEVVGFLDGAFGLAVAARNTLAALEASGREAVPVAVRAGRGRSASRASGATPGAPLPDLRIYVLNPPELAVSAGQWRGLPDDAAARVLVPFWELPRIPAIWEPVVRAMDVVLAPTRFIGESFRRACPEVPVVNYPQAVFLPGAPRPDRAAFGLPAEAVVFAVVFDVGSDIERKNPWAALQAFREAFPGDQGVRLVVKARPHPGIRAFERQLAELRMRAAADPRVIVLERPLTYPEVLSFYASCDVLLALHRSEGLGLHLMEAMSLGRVAVATGWSGNADFMTAADAVLIPWRMVPVRTSHGHYRSELGREGQMWAEPDLAAAVEALRALRCDPELRRRMGAAAAASMERCRVEMTSGAAFRACEEALSSPRRRDALGPALWRTRMRLRGQAVMRVLGRLAAGEGIRP